MGINQWIVSTQLCEGYFRYREDGSCELAGISSFSISPDGLTYTFNLRTDAVWSDGAPVTAQHFVDGFNRIGPSASSYLLDPVSTFSATGTYTIEIVLNSPHAHFLDALATPAIMCPVRLDIPEANRPYVTNGPFVLDEWVPDVFLRLAKNGLYWGQGQVQIDEILFSIISDPAQQILDYQNGDLDVAAVPAAEYPGVISDPLLAPDVHEIEQPGFRYVGLNLSQSSMDDLDLRAALALSVDRGALLSSLGTSDWQVPMTGVIPPSMPSYQEASVGYGYDNSVAQARLGYYLTTHGGSASDITIEIWTYEDTVARRSRRCGARSGHQR